MPQVGVVMGSDSDLPVVKAAFEILDKFAVDYEIRISSAHRVPAETAEYAATARERGLKVLLAAAGGAAHLPGVLAAYTTLPVIGIPIKSGALAGADALYAIVQMPKGIPVATVAIDGSANAALLAVEILALTDENLNRQLAAYRAEMAEGIHTKNKKLETLGVAGYLQSKQ